MFVLGCEYSTFEVCGLSTKVESIEERKAEVLIKLRKYKLVEKEKFEGAYAYIIDIPQDKERAMSGALGRNNRHRSRTPLQGHEGKKDPTGILSPRDTTPAVKLGARRKKWNFQIVPSVHIFGR
jgi:hypothetical protein